MKIDNVSKVMTAYNNAKSVQQNKFNRFVDFYELYRGIYNEGRQSYNGRANLVIPYAYSTVETVAPRLVGSKPNIEVIGREPKDEMSATLLKPVLSGS